MSLFASPKMSLDESKSWVSIGVGARGARGAIAP